MTTTKRTARKPLRGPDYRTRIVDTDRHEIVETTDGRRIEP